MSAIGPQPAPHLAKRKHENDHGHEEVATAAEPSASRSSSPESSEKRRRVAGPAPPPQPSFGHVGPSIPPISTSKSRSSSSDSYVGPTPPPASKPRRVLGPAAPPAPLSERPLESPSDSDSSGDSFGPALPAAGASYAIHDDEDVLLKSAFDTDPPYVEQEKKPPGRDAWMLMPPDLDGLTRRLDPTKIRARKFNTGKGAGNADSEGGTAIWTETPEQKLKRLQNEAMGISAPASTSEHAKKDARKSKEEGKRTRKTKEKIDAVRGRSLMDEHTEKGEAKAKEDDPSKRAFDYQKDMGSGMKIGNKQRREMLNKAKGFGDRFSSGSFL